MDGGKKSRNPNKASADHRSDRKSATGMSGDPKKGGRGGKFTWEGADGYADEDLTVISSKNRTALADHRSDRKSATGMSGDPKKGGRGGKFTWEGADGYADEDLTVISSKNRTSKGGAAAKKDDGNDE